MGQKEVGREISGQSGLLAFTTSWGHWTVVSRGGEIGSVAITVLWQPGHWPSSSAVEQQGSKELLGNFGTILVLLFSSLVIFNFCLLGSLLFGF